MTEIRNLQFTHEEVDRGKLMAVLAYLGVLVFISLLAARDNRYAMFHTEQGLALFIFSIITYILFYVVDGIFLNFITINMCGGSLIFFLLKILIFALVVIGIINSVQGNAKKLPVVGDFGEKFNLFK